MSDEMILEVEDDREDAALGLPGSVIRGEEERKRVTAWLQEEFRLGEEERSGLLERVKKWRRQSEARPEREKKDKPWVGASNVAVPLMGTNVNGIYAMFKRSMQKLDPLCNVKAIESEDRDRLEQAEGLEKLMHALVESKNHINLRSKNTTILYDTIRLGTQFIRTKWERETRNYKRSEVYGNQTVSQVVRNTPDAVPIKFEDFLTRSGFHDLQTAPWIAVATHLYEHELDQRAATGMYSAEAVERVKAGAGRTDLLEEDEERLSMHGLGDAGGDNTMYDIYEVFFYWDVDGDGQAEDIMWWFEPITGTVLREDFNDLGKRPVVALRYFGFPWELYAMGVGWMCEHMQDEIDAIHNMRIDGTKLAMLQMLAKKRGASTAAVEELYPGKVWELDDVGDIREIRFPPIAGDTFQAEMYAKEWAARFVGAPDSTMGFEDQSIKTRATFGGTSMLMQQGMSLQDAIRETVYQGYAEMFENILYHLVRNRDEVERTLLPLIPRKYHGPVMEALSVNPEDIPQTFAFTIKTTRPEETEEAKRQGMMTFANLYMVFGQQMFQLLPTMFDQTGQVPPPIKEVAAKFVVGAGKMMDGILKHFGFEDTTEFVPDMREAELLLEMIEKARTAGLEQMRDELAASGGAGGPGGGAIGVGGGGPVRGAGGQPGGMAGPQGPGGGAPIPGAGPPPQQG